VLRLDPVRMRFGLRFGDPKPTPTNERTNERTNGAVTHLQLSGISPKRTGAYSTRVGGGWSEAKSKAAKTKVIESITTDCEPGDRPDERTAR
jgi:hypothetical protein